jgi:hypothetical protein
MDCVVLKESMSLKEYRQHEKAACILFGKGKFKMTLSGCFMCDDGEPAWLHNAEIKKIGCKYVHVQPEITKSEIIRVAYPFEDPGTFKIWKKPIW